MYIKNIDQQKKKELELKKNAEEDPLTGLFNRNTTLALINKALKQDNNTLCALFMLDIDNFKHLNDTYGHLYGDAVLSEMAQKLSSIFRKNDIVGRLGGDEFMVFLKHIPDETLAEQKARQICQTLQTTYSSGNQLCEISCSVGFALTPQHGRHFNTLYEKADIALYHAKNQGKNRYSIYCDGMTKINLNLRQPPVPLKKYMGKTFSDNITEYVFKILYHSDDLALSIHAVLELLAKHYDAQHAYVFEYALLHKTYSLRYEWCAQGIAEQKDWMQNLTKEHLDEYWKLFDEDGVYCVEDTRQISSKIVAITKRVGAKAFLQCAIVIGGEFKGFIGVDDCHHPRKATEKERDTMKFVSEIIGIFLNAKHSEQEKEQHSAALQTMMDNLTNAVYVVNPRNHRLIFKNRQGSIESPQAKLGQPCYQGLQGFAAPCPQCPMLHLKQDLQAKETKELYVPSTGKWVHVSISWIHWPDGEHYCMMSCMDITSYKEPRNK